VIAAFRFEECGETPRTREAVELSILELTELSKSLGRCCGWVSLREPEGSCQGRQGNLTVHTPTQETGATRGPSQDSLVLREITTNARQESRGLGAREERKKERVGVRVFENCREPGTKHQSNVIASRVEYLCAASSWLANLRAQLFQIGIGGRVTPPPLLHQRTCGSAYGGSAD
jgi:hypothetical protein